MSDAIIPKEKQSAYQRWELNSFGDERPSTKAAAPAPPPPPKINVEQVARIREEARQEGHAIGLEEGRAAGLAQGRADAAAERNQLKQITESFIQEMAKADEVIAQDILNLALDMTKAMLKTALIVKPELVIPIVSEAIRYLPSLQQPALLFLHPKDAALIKEAMSDELTKAGWRIAEDMQIARGGCRIETASNQIDATAQTRWHRLAEALGKESDWIE